MDVSQLSSLYANPNGVARCVSAADDVQTPDSPHRAISAVAAQAAQLRTDLGIDKATASPASAPADSCLPPPKAPSAPITARTNAAFASLSASVDEALETLKIRVPRIDWRALTPEVPTNLAPQAAAQAAKATAKTASASLSEMGRQFNMLGSQDLFVAFMMLRQQAHGHGLRVNEQMADMASAVRQAMISEQQRYDREATVLLDRAIAQQAKLNRTAVWLEGMTAFVSSALAILMATSGVGLALTVGAIGIGFVAGGAIGGRAHDERFNLSSAFRGASVGAVVVPLLETLSMAYVAAGHLAGPQVQGWLLGVPTAVAECLTEITPAVLKRAGLQVSASFEYIFEHYILSIMTQIGPEARLALWAADPVMRSVSGIYQASVNYRVTRLDLRGRTAQNLGKMCAQAAKEAQERWKNTSSFLSGMQESHNEAVEQSLRMLSMHHQTMLKTVGYLR